MKSNEIRIADDFDLRKISDSEQCFRCGADRKQGKEKGCGIRLRLGVFFCAFCDGSGVSDKIRTGIPGRKEALPMNLFIIGNGVVCSSLRGYPVHGYIVSTTGGK